MHHYSFIAHTHSHTHAHTHTHTHAYTHIHLTAHTHRHTVKQYFALTYTPPTPPPTASVHVYPVPGRGAALRGVRVVAGGAAWRHGGVDPGRGGGRVPGGEGSLVGTVGRRGSRPAEKTSPGDLVGRHRGQV